MERTKEYVRRVVTECQNQGLVLLGVNTGDCIEHCSTVDVAVDHVFSVDDSTVVFLKNGKRVGIFMVLDGDCGNEVVNDHHVCDEIEKAIQIADAAMGFE